MPTHKAIEQISELSREIAYHRKRHDDYRTKSYGSEDRQFYSKAANAEYTKILKIEERIEQIKKFGLSTYELGKLKKELSGFKTITYNKSLGMRDKVVIGHSNVLGTYVKISYVSYNSFMRNVRGMGSLSGTKDIDSITPISKQTYDMITQGVNKSGGTRSSGSFMGGSWDNRRVEQPKPIFPSGWRI